MSTKKSQELKSHRVGFGSWESTTPQEFKIIKSAIVNHGFRHIDTAAAYENEEQIGDILQEVFKTSGIKREDLFITTKCQWNNLHGIEDALKTSLKRLKLDYVDLYLIHWPVNLIGNAPNYKMGKVPIHVQWKEMERLCKQGLTRYIGVSNFNFQLLNDLLTYAEIKPVCNQIELHPYLQQTILVEWLKKQDIIPVAYSPLARGGIKLSQKDALINHPVIKKIAEKHGRTPGQIILAWGLARGHIVIPRTSNEARAQENIQSLDVKLTEEDMSEIKALDRNQRVCDPVQWNMNVDIPTFV